MTRKWAVGAVALAFVLAVPGIAAAQCDVTEQEMLDAFDQIVDISDEAIPPDADFDDDGVLTRDEMGAFGALCEAGGLDTAIQDAFAANRAQAAADLGSFGLGIAPGFDELVGYLTTIIGDGEGEPTDDVLATINGFGDALGGVNDRTDLQPDYDDSQAAATKSAVFDELGIAAQTVVVNGPNEVFVGFGGTYTASTIDQDDPMFSETHTFSSSDPSILEHLGDGVYLGKAIGTADAVATGDTSGVVGTRTVNVVAPAWHDKCTIDDAILTEGQLIAGVLGCLLTGGTTNDFFSPDYDLDALFLGAAPTPDSFQFALLAYAVCEEVLPDAVASHDANVAAAEAFATETADLRTWIAPTTVTVSGSPGSISLEVGGSSVTLTASTEDQDDTDVTGTYTFSIDDSAVATVNGGSADSGVAGGTGVTVAAVGEGAATITIVDETFGATDEVVVTVDDLATNDVSISGPSDVNVNETHTYTATTAGPDSGETHTWSVAGGDATIGASTGELDSGTIATDITITATGDDSTETAMLTVTVHAGTQCDSAKALGDPGEPSPTSGPIIEILTAVAIWDGPATGGSSGGSYGEILAAECCGVPVGTADALDAGFAGVLGAIPLLGGLELVLEAFEDIDAVTNNVGAAFGITSEYAGITLSILGADSTFADDFGLPGDNLFNIAESGHALGDTSDGWASLASSIASLTGVGSATLALDAEMSDDTLLAPPDITDIVPDVIGSDIAKVAGFEVFDGGSVFAPGVNPIDLTNEEIADAVLAAGGDHFDFVDVAAGLNLLSPGGSTFLPAAGALAVGLLIGGMAFGGARRLRRQS